jgi:tRNA nucleotidyltransferase/poly(A) polymerase
MNEIDFPNPQKRAIELVRETAIEKACHPYLVGGPVRDLLLGRNAFDIDLTLEGDSAAFSRALAKRLNGRVRSFPQFLTYKVIAADMPEIDIATARKERYRKPGALPAVSPGRLKDDLLRRDFSINAIAIDVITQKLHDPTGGERDLRERRVRVLHEQSFIDDPTRIYRAVRLAARLGFEIDDESSKLMRAAIEGGALNTVAKERIWRELFFAMDEADAPQILAELNARGAFRDLFGNRNIDLSRLKAVQKQIETNPELDRYVLYTSAMLYGDASPIELEGSGFSQKRARNIVQIANEVPRFTDALADAKTERHRFRVLRHASPEMLSVIAATTPESVTVARYNEYQNFKLALRGNDLEVPGGPHVARALERTREAVFTGEIAAEEARKFARELAMRYYTELKIEIENPQ